MLSTAYPRPTIPRLSQADIQKLSMNAIQNGWAISPLATGIYLSKGDTVPFRAAAHLKVLSDKIVDAVTGAGKKYLLVSMPPRHGKSWQISKYTPLWFLKNWPHKEIILTGYGADFASDWGRIVRNAVSEHKLDLGFNLASDSKKQNRWHTTKGGAMVTAGVGGPITGRGADLLILDDVIKNSKEAFSSTYREEVWHWWTTTARTRLAPGGTIIVVMTRWHEEDLIGRLLNPEYNEDWAAWEVLNLPAIWGDVAPGVVDKTSVDAMGRTCGQALWPWRYNIDALEALKRSVGPETWYAMYQGVPLSKTGIGSIYKSYDDDLNIDDSIERDTMLPLAWSLDFNVDPMASVICQIRQMRTPLSHITNELRTEIEVLDEIVLPDSNTPQACDEFWHRCESNGWVRRGLDLHIYGDVSGNQRNTSGSKSDWEIVKEFFKSKHGITVTYHIGKENPPVKDRVNAVNAACCSAAGERRLKIKGKCKELRKDLKEVRWKKDASGNPTGQIDKSDTKRTHASDALGYIVYQKFALKQKSGEKAGFLQ